MTKYLSRLVLRAAQTAPVRALAERSPLARPVAERFIAGSADADALAAATRLTAAGCLVTLNHLGEHTAERHQAAQAAAASQRILRLLADTGLATRADISVKLSSLGRSLPGDGQKIALDHARAVCAVAGQAGATVTLDMEEYPAVESTLEILRELRTDFPWAGAVLQAQLRRSEADCIQLATAGSRVRLCKGAYAAPRSVAFTGRSEVDASYIRCLTILFSGQGYPMVATHDPRMIAAAGELAAARTAPGTSGSAAPGTSGTAASGASGSYEYQMLYGFRAEEQRRLAAAGRRVRVYVPYGSQWYEYFIRRLAERPANLRFFLTGLARR